MTEENSRTSIALSNYFEVTSYKVKGENFTHFLKPNEIPKFILVEEKGDLINLFSLSEGLKSPICSAKNDKKYYYANYAKKNWEVQAQAFKSGTCTNLPNFIISTWKLFKEGMLL